MQEDSNHSDKASQIFNELVALPLTQRREYAEQWPDLDALETELMDAQCPDAEVDLVLSRLQFYQGGMIDESARLYGMLRASIQPPDVNSTRAAAANIEETFKPRYRTMIPALYNLTFGGGYGLTTVAGDAKAGKTMFAIGAPVSGASDADRSIASRFTSMAANFFSASDAVAASFPSFVLRDASSLL